MVNLSNIFSFQLLLVENNLRIAGIPENTEHDDTDTAILNICQAISVDPPVQPSDIAVSHQN